MTGPKFHGEAAYPPCPSNSVEVSAGLSLHGRGVEAFRKPLWPVQASLGLTSLGEHWAIPAFALV